MIDAYWYAGARTAHEGQSVYSKRGGGHPDRRADRPGGRPPVLRPGVPRPRVHAVRDRVDLGQRAVGLRQRPAARRAPTGSPTAVSRALIQTRLLRGDDRAARDAVRRQPGARGRRRHRHDRRPRRRHRARAAADLPVVHPRGRPAVAAAHRPDPRRRLPRRERRDHRRGQQLPVQREPDRPAQPVHATPRRPRRASAASGATTTSRAPRRRPCGSPTSTCRASPRRTEPTCNLSAPDRV